MRFVVQLDGVVLDPAEAFYEAHRQAAGEVGWSTLDQRTFWRMTRKQGSEANFLRGAKPPKLAAYNARFSEALETDEVITRLRPHDGVQALLADLAARGPVVGVTLGSNLERRRAILDGSKLAGAFTDQQAGSARVHSLDPDPRRRPGQIRVLADGDVRAMVVAASEVIVRSASSAEMFTVGIASGDCSDERLHQAGASIVYRTLAELVDSLQTGGQDLIRAGLLPPPFDG